MHLNEEYVHALEDACYIAAKPDIVQDVYLSKDLALHVSVNRGFVLVSYFDYEDKPEVFTALLEDCKTRCEDNTLGEVRSATAWVIEFKPLRLA